MVTLDDSILNSK